MAILVTGAAGYIGSVVTEEPIREGNRVIALDNLQQGHREALSRQAGFVLADLGNPAEVESIFRKHEIDAVMHLAAESIVAQSVTDPGKFFRNNVLYSISLLDTMLRCKVNKFIFSSSASVYGEPVSVPIKESASEQPVNPYGESKLMFERVLHWYGQAYGLRFISLRYFNAAGASELCGEDHHPETHLIPSVLRVALGQQEQTSVFGSDYPTRDGSCIRDYIHVKDIARAHLLALGKLDSSAGNRVYNLGNGRGFSVFEVIETARKVTGDRIPVVVHPRRSGDPAVLVADAALAKAELGWQPEYPALESIIESAWRWQRKHPHGYS